MALPDTPVMRQYAGLKAQHPDALLFFRMGDFYELFEDDALIASEALNITLTARRTSPGEDGVPMCGVPFHAAEAYLGKLLADGMKVAVADQVETPEEAKRRGGSGTIVRREVVRLYTPGTLTEDSMLEPTRANYLAAIALEKPQAALAWVELSTGETAVRILPEALIKSALAALQAGEVVVSPTEEATALGVIPRRQISVQSHLFDPERAVATLQRAYNVQEIAGLGVPEGVATTALGALLAYAELTQMGRLPALRRPQVLTRAGRLTVDASTQKNLELVSSLGGKRAESLLGSIDYTCTGAGARLLAKWVCEPSADVAEIHTRQAAWRALAGGDIVEPLQKLMAQTGDVARAMSRLLLGRGGPRDLGVLRATGRVAPELSSVLERGSLGVDGPRLGVFAAQIAALKALEPVTKILDAALTDENLPFLPRDGGFVADGYDQALDGYRRLQTDAHALLTDLETREVTKSGIGAKLKFNKVWGYYLEATTAQMAGKTIPEHWRHRQTTTTGQRFTTPELVELERDVANAGGQALAREQEIFEQLVQAVRAASVAILDVSLALAQLDVYLNAALLATKYGWVQPTVEDGMALSISEGRHPVVAPRVPAFVPNDTDLSGGQFWLLTGPNMAGKSTFLRQTALLVILAQIGYPVPAKAMRLGIVDQLFSRIGAADNLAAGQSTFMVEMVETAQILSRATSKSLVILDEIGRGTATYDGLALAWACVEDLAQRLGCRTLFATHYHELTTVATKVDHVSVHRVAVKEWKGDIVFLHKVEPGAAAGSYGVQVAKLAGVPPHVVSRADGILQGLLKSARVDGVAKVNDLSLFAHPILAPEAPKESLLEIELKRLDVDMLSPREALAKLYELKETAHGTK